MTTITKPLVNEFQINAKAVAAGVRPGPYVIGLSSNRILVARVERSSRSSDSWTGIIAKIYDADGRVVRDDFWLGCDRILNHAQNNAQNFDIAATHDGGFMLVYIDTNVSSPNQTKICWQRFNGTGIPLKEVNGGGILTIENTDGTVLSNPQIAVNRFDNSFVITYIEHVGTSTNINARIVNHMGLISPNFTTTQRGHDFHRSGKTARLVNGNFVSVDETNAANLTTIDFNIFTPTGSHVQPKTTIDIGTDPHVASLNNGNFIVVYTVNNSINYCIYTPTGTPVMRSQLVASSVNNYTSPKVLALPDNSFVIIWDNDTERMLEAQRFNENGAVDGARFIYCGTWRYYPTKYWCFWRWSSFVYLAKSVKTSIEHVK